jgi:hypothetical protein
VAKLPPKCPHKAFYFKELDVYELLHASGKFGLVPFYKIVKIMTKNHTDDFG